MLQQLDGKPNVVFQHDSGPLHFYSDVTTFPKRQLPVVWFGQGVAHFLVSEISRLEYLDLFPGALRNTIFKFCQHLNPQTIYSNEYEQ